MNFIVKWVFKTVVGRWVTASLIAVLLSGSAWKWHKFKEDLIHKGQQVCVQEINKQTVIDLQSALAAEKSARAELTASLIAVAAVNQEARARLRESESKMDELSVMMAEQEKTDENYAAWSNTPLPAGVAERLLNTATGSDSDSVRDDSN